MAKVLFIIDSLRLGGAERVVAELLQMPRLQGIEKVCVTIKSEHLDYFKIPPDIQRITLGHSQDRGTAFTKLLRVIGTVLRLRSIIRKHHPDLVVSFIDQINICTSLATLGIKVPLVVSEQVSPRFGSWLRGNALKYWTGALFRDLLYLRARSVVVLSRESIQDFWWFIRNRIGVVPNAVWDEPSKESPQRWNPSGPAVVTLARLEPQKNLSLLIQAFAKTRNRFPEWHLYIFGEGSERENLEQLSERLGISSQVHLPGATSQPFEILRASEIYAVSSHYEGFPKGLLEALWNGKASVSTNCPTGPSDMIENGVTGFLVPRGECEQLAAKIETLMASKELRIKLGRAGQDKVKSTFSPEKIEKSWMEILRIQ